MEKNGFRKFVRADGARELARSFHELINSPAIISSMKALAPQLAAWRAATRPIDPFTGESVDQQWEERKARPNETYSEWSKRMLELDVVAGGQGERIEPSTPENTAKLQVAVKPKLRPGRKQVYPWHEMVPAIIVILLKNHKDGVGFDGVEKYKTRIWQEFANIHYKSDPDLKSPTDEFRKNWAKFVPHNKSIIGRFGAASNLDGPAGYIVGDVRNAFLRELVGLAMDGSALGAWDAMDERHRRKLIDHMAAFCLHECKLLPDRAHIADELAQVLVYVTPI